MPLRERIKEIFKKYGVTVSAIFLAAGITIGAVVGAIANALKSIGKQLTSGLKAVGECFAVGQNRAPLKSVIKPPSYMCVERNWRPTQHQN